MRRLIRPCGWKSCYVERSGQQSAVSQGKKGLAEYQKLRGGRVELFLNSGAFGVTPEQMPQIQRTSLRYLAESLAERCLLRACKQSILIPFQFPPK